MRKKIGILLIIIMIFTLQSCSTKENREIDISVAASLYDPIKKLSDEFTGSTNIKVNINTGGSGTLKKQIYNGANIGIFISANDNYVDELMEEGLVKEEGKRITLKNKLVLIGEDSVNTTIENLHDLKKINGKIAIGESSTVPAGEYAKESLESINIYDDIKEKLVFSKDVTSVRSYVERGEAQLGFVYKSDTVNMKNAKILLEIDENLHQEIIYTGAIIEGYKNSEDCMEFMKFITSSKGKDIFKEYSFELKE